MCNWFGLSCHVDHGNDIDYAFSFILAVNAFIVFKSNHPTRRLTRLAFTEQVCTGLIGGYRQQRRRVGRPSSAPNPPRLTARHFVDSIPNNRRLQCIVCGKLNRQRGIFRGTRISTHCPACNVALCRHQCFQKYHTFLRPTVQNED